MSRHVTDLISADTFIPFAGEPVGDDKNPLEILELNDIEDIVEATRVQSQESTSSMSPISS